MNQPNPFNDPQANPLPDANDIERQAQDQRAPQMKSTLSSATASDRHQLKKLFLGLLAIGLVVGILTATGVVWLLNRFDLVGVPDAQEQVDN
jgi:hypothetical protein